MFDEQKLGEQELAADLVSVERQLRELTPALPRIERDRLMFEAGRAAGLKLREAYAEPSPGPARQSSPQASLQGRGNAAATQRVAGTRHWFWPMATVTMTAATLLLATMLVWQTRTGSIAQSPTEPQAAVEIVSANGRADAVRTDEFPGPSIWSPPASSGYLGIRYIALTRGIGALTPELQMSAADANGSHQRPVEPLTPRGMLEEFLPATAGSSPSRS